MSMSKKDFIALADVVKAQLAQYPPTHSQPAYRALVVSVVKGFLPHMRRACANFDEARFLAACTIQMSEVL